MSRPVSARPSRADFQLDSLAALAILASTLMYIGWEWSHRGVFAYAQSIYPISDADEWRYTACSRLVEHGYSLFTQVFSAQPPLLFVVLSAGMRLFGDSIAGARIVEILFGLTALWGTAALAGLLAGRWAAAISAVALAVSPGFLVYSHTVEGEGPQMALGVVALLCATAWRRWENRTWLVTAGLALAASVLTKLFALETAAPLLWLLCTGRRWDRRLALDLAVVTVAALFPLVCDFALISPAQQWSQVVSLHSAAAGLRLPNAQPAVQIVMGYVRLDLGLSIAACLGFIALCLVRRWYALGLCGLWLGGSVAMLLLFKPLFPHHPAILAAPLAVTAGTGLSHALGGARSSRTLLVLCSGAALAYAAALPGLIHADRHLLVATAPPATLPLSQFVRRDSAASELIAVDDLEIADGAHRLVVPPLCDPSNVRLRAGYLTASEAIGATERYRPALVVESLGIYGEIPGYLPWLRRQYRVLRAPGGAAAFVPRRPVRR